MKPRWMVAVDRPRLGTTLATRRTWQRWALAAAATLVLAATASPATAEPCGGVTASGCCDGTTLKYCSAQSTLLKANCAAFGMSPCGWDGTFGMAVCAPSSPADPPQGTVLACPGAPSACAPDCTGKVCGDDGCGGTCGTCKTDQECATASGTCVAKAAMPCGDIPETGCCDGTFLKVCNKTQGLIMAANCVGIHAACAYDPSGVLGIGAMDCSASPPADQSKYQACPKTCTPQCKDKQCGDDGCGGTCGTCAGGKTCDATTSQCVCKPQCDGKTCGGDGCGGSCGSCSGGKTCDAATGTCKDQVCGGIPQGVGCCDGSTFKFCNAIGVTTVTDCGAKGKFCGWHDGAASYYCQSTDTGGDPSGKFPKACPGGCAPNCKDKACGDDGCGGQCGKCGANETCDAKTSTCTCVPKCDGKACGDDGCGGPCGTCGLNQACQTATGLCLCKPSCDGKTCGDDGCGGSCGTCGAGTTCDTKVGTCKAVDACGGVPKEIGCCDGQVLKNCSPWGTYSESNCGAKGKFCGWYSKGGYYYCMSTDTGGDPSGTYPKACSGGCAADCKGKACGSDGCGGQCGSCEQGEVCDDKTSQCVCKPQCDGKTCGPDGCGGSCGTCTDGKQCNSKGTCICLPNCWGKSCGDDGCGGSCGSCGSGKTCDTKTGACLITACIGHPGDVGCCAGKVLKVCGVNGYAETDCGATGKHCAWFAYGDGTGGYYTCRPNDTGADPSGGAPKACPGQCAADCKGKTCGDDGCGGSCGSCEAGKMCSAKTATCVCKPKCDGKTCGDDGCGGQCGTCAQGTACDASGTCICDPVANCKGKVCGSDGCGGECKPGCPGQKTCDGATGQCVGSFCGDVPEKSGCCVGAVLHTCGISGQTVTYDCNAKGMACGWHKGSGTYTCMVNPTSDPSGATPRLCKQAGCKADCAGKTCGDDGCGGSCGACTDANTYCSAEGACKCGAVCLTKECGDDGCGGDCGACAKGTICSAGIGKCVTDPCQGAPAAGCCDGQKLQACVDGKYVEESCAASGKFCAWDGDGYGCVSKDLGPDPAGKTAKTCEGGCNASCKGKTCGDDGCGGSCGSCAADEKCSASSTCDKLCKPDCTGKTCGPDGCGGTCGVCNKDQSCTAGVCVAVDKCKGIPAVGCCDGNSVRWCNKGKSVAQTPCAATSSCSWNTYYGKYACNFKDAGPEPTGTHLEQCPGGACVPKCEGRDCGPDGCGGLCGPATCFDGAGTCLANGTCCAHKCTVTKTLPNNKTQTVKKVCGDNGCGGSCGSCAPGSQCSADGSACVCVPQCNGKACGPDGCGGTCGTCPASGPNACDPKTGTCSCVKQCAGKTCGPDGCGGTCGACAQGSACNAKGVCEGICTPDCKNKSCGSDGCGGSCGACAAGSYCDAKSATCMSNLCPAMPSAGCCEGDVAKVCTSTGASSVSCAAVGQVCGWDPAKKGFGCVAVANSLDPESKHPRTCPGAKACTPNCWGKSCGPDGCGGFCGTCYSGTTCKLPLGKCVSTACAGLPSKNCCSGNVLSYCDSKGQFKKTNCLFEGAKSCGWNATHNEYLCLMTANGGDEPGGASTKTCPSNQCVPSCWGKQCGSDGCGGTCGVGCGEAFTCNESTNKCELKCIPSCSGKSCGPDGCGGICGVCKEGFECASATGACLKKDPCAGIPTTGQGGGCCDGNTLKYCLFGGVQSKTCEGSGAARFCGWSTIYGGAYGCGTLGGADPSGAFPRACPGTAACVPDCKGKACGPDGCGGWCGQCKVAGEICDVGKGTCVESCEGIPMEGCCDGKILRSCSKLGGNQDYVATWVCDKGQGCGWNANASAYSCNQAPKPDPTGFRPMTCPKPACTADCAGKTCGDDGCGGSCGDCPAGTSCFAVTGACVVKSDAAACGKVGWEGGCDGTTAKYCSNGTLVSLDCKGLGAKCGWIAAVGAYGCGGSDGADPTGTTPKQLPGATSACVPACTGRVCGADGCGGSCGACAKGAACSGDGQCVAPLNVSAAPQWGCCEGPSTLRRTTLSGEAEVISCSGAGSDCGFDAAQGRFVCGKIADGALTSEDPSGKRARACPVCTPNAPSDGPCSFDTCGRPAGVCAGATTCDYKTGQCKPGNGGSCNQGGGTALCGTFEASWTCQCDAACLGRGDCCADFELTCGATEVGGFKKGDGVCNAAAFETCATSPEDCQACPDPTYGKAPWYAPYALDLSTGKAVPGKKHSLVFSTQDWVLPTPQPVPADGLLAWVPHLADQLGAPSATVLNEIVAGKTCCAAVDATDGATGLGFRLGLDGGKPSFGKLRVRPGVKLPAPASYTEHSGGGFTVAFWAKVPKAAGVAPNPLVALPYHAPSQGEAICGVSRAQDSALTLACPSVAGGAVAQQIVDIEAYYGEAEVPAATAASTGAAVCKTLGKVRRTYKCHDKGIQAFAEKACLGKASCLVNGWDSSKDPCSAPPHVPNASRLILRAVCDYAAPKADMALVVEPAADGGRLRFEGPGIAPVRSKDAVAPDVWTHVAVTFHPFSVASSGLGTLALYLNGDEQAVTTEAIPGDFYELVFGLARIGGVSAAWPNAVGQAAATSGVFDEVLVYQRALSRDELATLSSLPAAKLVRLWPSQTPQRLLAQGAMLSGKAGVAPVEASHLWEPIKLVTGGKPKPLRAPYDAIALPAGAYFTATTSGYGATWLYNYALLGWVRVAELKAGKELMRLTLGGKPQVVIATHGDCGGHAIVVTQHGKTKEQTKTTAVANCEHGVAANEWAFVAAVRFGDSVGAYVDGHFVGSAQVSGEILAAPATEELTFRAGDGVDLLWAGLFSGLTAEKARAWRGVGPDVLLDGETYSDQGKRRPRDWAWFHNNGASGATDQPRLYDASGAAIDSTGGTGGAMVLGGTGAVGRSVVIPARGRLGSNNGVVSRPFAFAGRVDKDLENLITLHGYPAAVGWTQVFKARLECSREVATDDPKARDVVCVVKVFAMSTSGTFQQWASAPRRARVETPTLSPEHFNYVTKVNELDIQWDIAVSWDGSDPKVALGTSTLVRYQHQHELLMPGKLLKLEKVPGFPATEMSSSTAALDLTEPHFVVRGSYNHVQTAWSNMRLYGRSLSDLELERLARRGCEQLACEASGRQCRESNSDYDSAGAVSAACGSCQKGFHDGASGAGALCVTKRAFHVVCTANEQCVTGLCANGRCATKDNQEACQTGCDALHRKCVSTQTNEGTVLACSTGCKDYFAQPTKDPEGSACVWLSGQAAGAVCTNHAECASGYCMTESSATYASSVNWTPGCQAGSCEGWSDATTGKLLACNKGLPPSGGWAQGDPCPPVVSASVKIAHTMKRCAAATIGECKALHRSPEIRKGAGLFGKDAVACPDCDATMYDGKPIWVKGWSIMGPTVCKKLHLNLIQRWREGKAQWTDLDAEPSFDLFDRFYFNKETGLQPAEISQLEKDGVGPGLIEFMRGSAAARAAIRAKWGRVQLSDCAKSTFWLDFAPPKWLTDPKTGKTELTYQKEVASPFADPGLNGLTCVANKFKNGTPCPPPGSNASLEQANSFCESGFCARDTQRCEEGYARYEKVIPADRGDDQKPDSESDLGPIALTQANNGNLEIRKAKASPVDADSEPGAPKPRSYNLGGGNKQALGAFGAPSFDFFYLANKMSVAPEADEATFDSSVFLMGIKMPQTGKPATECGGWENGQYKKADDANGKSCGTWSGVADATPSLPTAKLCTPNPFGCKEKNDKTIPNFAGKPPKKVNKSPPTCWSQTTFAGPVPITISAELGLAICFGTGTAIDGETNDPQFVMTPEVGVGLDIKGGVGFDFLSGAIEVAVGLKVAITIASLAFPITWGLNVVAGYKEPKAADAKVKDLYHARFYRKVELILTVLKLDFGLFAEMTLGWIFNVSWEQMVFSFPGFTWKWELENSTLQEKTIDLQMDFKAD